MPLPSGFEIDSQLDKDSVPAGFMLDESKTEQPSYAAPKGFVLDEVKEPILLPEQDQPPTMLERGKEAVTDFFRPSFAPEPTVPAGMEGMPESAIPAGMPDDIEVCRDEINQRLSQIDPGTTEAQGLTGELEDLKQMEYGVEMARPISTVTGEPVPTPEEEAAGGKAAMAIIPYGFASAVRGMVPGALERAVMDPITKAVVGKEYVSPIDEALKIGKYLPEAGQMAIGAPAHMAGAIVPLSVSFKTAGAIMKAVGLPPDLVLRTGPVMDRITAHVARGGIAGAVYGGLEAGTPKGMAEDAAFFGALEGGLGAVGGIFRKLFSANWYRNLEVSERGLVVQAADDLLRAGHSEGTILRTLSDPIERGRLLEEAARKRMMPEEPAAPGLSETQRNLAKEVIREKMAEQPPTPAIPEEPIPTVPPGMPPPVGPPPAGPAPGVLPPGQGFGLVEPAPEVKLRPAPPTYPPDAEYVAGRPAPEELIVEHKPILGSHGLPWKEEEGALKAFKSKRLKDMGVTEETHEIVPFKKGFGIARKTEEIPLIEEEKPAVEIPEEKPIAKIPKKPAEPPMSPELKELHEHKARTLGFEKAGGSFVEGYLKKLAKVAEKTDMPAATAVYEALSEYKKGNIEQASLEAEKILGKLHKAEKLVSEKPPIKPKPKEKMISFNDLGERAKGAIASDAMGKGQDAKEFINSKWMHKTVDIESLKEKNKSVWSDSFVYRKSETKGPLIVAADGEILDGNNRLREAIEKKDKQINILERIEKPKPKEPIAEPSAKEPWEMTHHDYMYSVFPKLKPENVGPSIIRPTRETQRISIEGALKSGELTPETYKKLHAEDYGPLGEFVPEVVEKPEVVPKITAKLPVKPEGIKEQFIKTFDAVLDAAISKGTYRKGINLHDLREIKDFVRHVEGDLLTTAEPNSNKWNEIRSFFNKIKEYWPQQIRQRLNVPARGKELGMGQPLFDKQLKPMLTPELTKIIRSWDKIVAARGVTQKVEDLRTYYEEKAVDYVTDSGEKIYISSVVAIFKNKIPNAEIDLIAEKVKAKGHSSGFIVKKAQHGDEAIRFKGITKEQFENRFFEKKAELKGAPEVEKESVLKEPEAKYLIAEFTEKYRQSEFDLAFGGKKKADEATESVAKEVDRVSHRGMPDRVAGEPAKSKVAEEMRKKKYVDLTGRKLTTGNESQEIAELFQVYRSPKMEILHAIYISKDGIILGHNALTSGNMGAVGPTNAAKYIYKMQSAAKRLGAAKVHILHNHPSGNPTMSREDLGFANGMRKKLGGLYGEFVVIDHGKFTWVSEYGREEGRTYAYTTEGTYKVTPDTGEWMARKGPLLKSPQAVAAFGNSLAYDKTKVCFVYVDGGNNVVGWSTHGNKILKKSIPELEKIVRQQAKGHNAAKAVIIAEDMALLEPIAEYGNVENWLLDALALPLYAEGKSLREAVPDAFEVAREPTKPAWGLFEPEVEYKRPWLTKSQKERRAKKKAIKEKQLKIENAKEAKEQIHGMIRDRRQNLNLSAYETNLFINDIEQQTTKIQREIIPFIIEKTDIPESLNRPDLEKAYEKDKDNLAPIALQVKQHFDAGWLKMKKNIPDMSAEQIENYVTHIWDLDKGQKRIVTNWFITQNRFLKKRYIETLKEGIEELGLTPKVLDISEIIRIHDGVANRAIENVKFVEGLKNLKYEGMPLIARADLAPQNWVYFDHPALRRGLVIPGKLKMGEKVSPELSSLLEEMGVAIGRRISPVAFGKPVGKAGEYISGEPPKVRFQRFMSSRTVAHEIGHHLDEVLGLGYKFLNNYASELYAINRERIEGRIGKVGKYGEAYARSTEEQIAEFFATLFTDASKAYKIAPNATADALNRLRQDEVLSKLIDFDFEKQAKNLVEEQLNTLVKLPVKVYPDLEKPLKVIFESRIDHPAIQAYEVINGVLKKTNLSLSLFHHGALGETGIAIMGARKVLNIYFNPVKIYKAMVQGRFDIFEKEPIARRWIGAGLQVGATADVPVNMIQSKLNNLARKTKNVPLINKTTEFVRTFNETWDKALWNYLHDTLKLYACESLGTKIDPTKDMTKQEQEITQFVNDTFGGQNWDTLMVSPKSLQIMTWSLLSADWTTSTVRQALSPTGIGRAHKETISMRRKLGAYFWIKAGLYFGVGINMLNYTFREWDEKEYPEYYKGMGKRTFLDKTMAGNTMGHKTHLFVGRYEDGTERYIRWGKQFRELPELFFDDTGFSPISATFKKVGGKLAPVVQLTSKITTGTSPSGFRDDDIYGKKGWDRVYGMGKVLIKSPLPFATRALFQEDKKFHLTDLAMPSSKGMTRWKSINLFKHAIIKKDDQLLKETYQFTLMNNLPAYTLFSTALTILKAESTKEFNEGIKTIEGIEKSLDKVDSPKDLIRLKNKLKRILKENADRKLGMDLLDQAIIDIKKYEIVEGK